MWKILRKICFFGCLLFTFACVSLSLSKNVNAAQIGTNGINFYNAQLNENNYQWSSYLSASNGQFSNASGLVTLTNVRAIRSYGMRFDSLYSNGNYASMHFETNLVAWGSYTQENPNANHWINRDRLVVQGCSFNNRALTIETQTINTAVTKWTDYSDSPSYGFLKHTLTVYGDITFSNVPSGSTGTIVCDVSTNNSSDFFWSNGAYGQYVYWEKNPTILVFGSNINDALLQTQIEQNETIINQNQTIINNQNELNDFLTDDTPPNVDSSALSQSAGWLPAGPVDSILTLPISLLQGVVNVFTNPSVCQDIILPLPFVNTDLTLPCVGPILSQIGITPLWNVVGAIIGFFLIWNTLKWLYKFVDDTLTMRENESSLWGGL